MQDFYLHYPLNLEMLPQDDVVLVLGYFDGVHLGHQKVIEKGYEISAKMGLKLAVMTLDKRPQLLFQKFNKELKKVLTPPCVKRKIFSRMGVDYCYTVNFTDKFARLAPKDFVGEYLVNLNAKVVVAGFDYNYGRHGKATAADLLKYTEGRFSVKIIRPFVKDGQKVSSTLIRKLIEQGSVAQANSFLGFRYETSGFVVRGEARGRTIGFPTANIEVAENVKLPALGVYVNEILINGKKYPAMGSIGTNETFGENLQATLELNILDFADNIYGENVKIYWHEKLREQKKFANAEKLIEQLKLDQKRVVDYFYHQK